MTNHVFTAGAVGGHALAGQLVHVVADLVGGAGWDHELRSLIMRHDVFVTETNQGAQKWTCSMCGDEHVGLATVFGPMAPYAWLNDERSDRRKGHCDGDMCFMTDRTGGTQRYIRGHLQLRVHDADLDYFIWSVWVELAKDEFNLNSDHWEDPDRALLPPSPGHLATVLPYEQETLGLRVRLFNREPGAVPLVKLDPDQDHPLVAEQRQGISLHRVTEINEQLLH